MNVLYFATIRETIGRAEEEVILPAHVATVGQFIDWLKEQSSDHARALGDLRAVRVAVNHEHVKLDHPLHDGDEVALFPPVTGG